MKIALCSLAYNSHKYIMETIGNMAPYVEEVCVLVDNRTTDDSREIIGSMSMFCPEVKIKDYKWIHNFGDAKNKCLEMTGDVDWIIWLSDDDKIKSSGCETITKRIRSMHPFIGGIILPQKNHYPNWSDSETDYIEGFYPNYHMVAFRKFEGLHCTGRIHEGFSWSVMTHGWWAIVMDDICRHHHAWKGNKELYEYSKYYYFEAIMQLSDDWEPGDEIPEGFSDKLKGWVYNG